MDFNSFSMSDIGEILYKWMWFHYSTIISIFAHFCVVFGSDGLLFAFLKYTVNSLNLSSIFKDSSAYLDSFSWDLVWNVFLFKPLTKSVSDSLLILFESKFANLLIGPISLPPIWILFNPSLMCFKSSCYYSILNSLSNSWLYFRLGICF